MKSFYWLIAYATWAQIIPYNWQPSEHLGGNHYTSKICYAVTISARSWLLLYTLYYTHAAICCITALIPPRTAIYWIALRSYYSHSHEHAHKQPSLLTSFSELGMLRSMYKVYCSAEYRWTGCRLYNHAVVQSECDLDWKTLDLHFT